MVPPKHTSNSSLLLNLSTSKGWVGLVGWPAADGLPHKWSHDSCRSSAGQGKFAG